MAEKGVVIRPSFCEAMKSLEKEDQLDLFWAICDYGIYGAEPQGLSTLAGAFFTLMQPSLEAAATRYSASAAGGASGGAPKGNQNARKKKPTKQPAEDTENNEAAPQKQPVDFEEQPENNPTITTAKATATTKATARNMTNDICSASEAGKPHREKKFIPPTQEEIDAYCRETGICVEASRFIDYYTSIGWKIGKNPMKDWQAAVRSWYAKNKARSENADNTWVLAPQEDPFEVAIREGRCVFD